MIGKGDITAQVGKTLKAQEGNPSIPRVPSSGNRPGCPPRRDPENPSRYARREEYEGEGGRVLVCRCP
jgi:hypothetical protein